MLTTVLILLAQIISLPIASESKNFKTFFFQNCCLFEDEEISGATDGTYQKMRYFNCPPNRGFFCKLSNLAPDSRFAPDLPVVAGN